MWYETQRKIELDYTSGIPLASSSPFCLVVYPIFSELKEQLLARSSRVEDFERLKIEFNEQKREIKEQNEAELESLRRYESTNGHVGTHTVWMTTFSQKSSTTSLSRFEI